MKIFVEKMCAFYAKLGRNKYTLIRHSNTFGIYDISDISSPDRLATIPVIGYAHNVWVDDSGDFLITTEETEQQTVKIWDISN